MTVITKETKKLIEQLDDGNYSAFERDGEIHFGNPFSDNEETVSVSLPMSTFMILNHEAEKLNTSSSKLINDLILREISA